MLLSKISLSGLFLTQVIEKLYIDKSKLEEHKLLQEINEKHECIILNPSFDRQKLNEQLKSFPINISNIIISKLQIYFNNNNLDSSISVENITIDLIKNEKYKEEIKSKYEKDNSSIDNFAAISGFLHNFTVLFKNIKIRLIEENIILYTLLINEINYQKNIENNDNGGEKDKEKFLFCNNKIINIGGIVLKEEYEENDEIYFNNNENINRVNFFTNPKILLVIYNQIKIFISHDYKSQKLLINNINYENLYIECIMNITQIKNLLKFKKSYLYNFEYKENNEKYNDINAKEFDLFGFKIKKFEININFNYCYFILLNSEKSINKFWMFYQHYFDKYYTMNIEPKKNQEGAKKLNILGLIQKHFCYFSKEYYLIYINQFKCSIKNNHSNFLSLISSSLIFKLIQPNKIPEKINVIIIDNKSKGNELDNRQSFNNLFLPYYKQVIQYGYYTHNIFIISNFELGNEKINFNELDVDINSFVFYNIYNFYKTIFNTGNEIKEEVIKDIKQEYNYIVQGKRINMYLMVNKKWIDYIKDRKSHSCFDSHFYSEKIILSFEDFNFNLNDTLQKILYKFYYNKIFVLFAMKNILYPLLYIINNKNNSISSNQIDNSIIISKLKDNSYNVESNYKYVINFDKIYSFINPILLNYYINQYLKLFFYTIDIFNNCKNKSKYKKQLFDDIEENLNIDNIFSQNEFENNKFYYWFLKIIKFFKNTDINIEEINFVFFCHLSISNNKLDIKNLFEKNEIIFKYILSPIIILKLKELSFKNCKIKLNNLLLFTKIKNENFNREDLIYKEIMGNIDIYSENYEFFIYKSKTNSNILEGEIKIDEKRRNVKIDLNMEEIVFCPIPNKFTEIVGNIEKNLNKYIRMNSNLFNMFPLINEKIDLINYEKILKNKHIYIKNQNNDIKYKIKLKCNKLFLDLYSTNRNKIFYDKNLFENIIEKNKMRLIIELEDILIDYIIKQKLNLTIQKINSAFLKDLRISQYSCCLLIDSFSLINYDFINMSAENSSNSLYFSNIVEDKKSIHRININNDSKLGSIIVNSGFVQILQCEKSISININLSSNNIIHNILGINTNNELIINDINLKFCKDSLKDIIYFCKKLPNDIQTLLNLKNAFKDDVEKIIVEKDTLSINNLKEQLKNKYIDTRSIEFRSVKFNGGEYQNNSMYNRLLNSTKDKDNENINIKTKNEDNMVINNILYENKNKNSKKNYKMNLFLKNINIYLYDGEDFNFQGSHTLVIFYHSAISAENKSQGNNVIKINERNINNNVLISLKDLECKYSQKINEIEINICLKSLIIEDNIENSIYKKLLSHFDFQNDKNIFFNSKIKITKGEKGGGDGSTDANALLDITPISIYLDKITLDFIINYYNVFKHIINHENDEDNEEDDIYSNDSNKKLNNRIIQNNDDIMNINNEDNDSNSNNELMAEQEISSINHFQNDNLIKSFLNPDKLYIKSLIINPFFISFNYNPKIENDSDEEIETFKNDDRNNKIYNYLKNISLDEFVINFKKYDVTENDKQIKIKNIFKELFNYYYNDIIDYKSFNNYVKALPVVNKFCSIFEGFFNIWQKTINHEKNNNTMKEGFVEGTQDLVVNTTCSILSIGESITNYLTKILNINENENNNEGIIKIIKKKINQKLSKKEDYYYK